jgi:hypothetical protein
MRWLLFMTCVLLGGCGTSEVERIAVDRAEAGPGDAVIAIRMEPTNGGVFIEGFDVDLQFIDANGNEIASRNWADYVRSLPRIDDDLEIYYDSVLEEPVPAGVVTVRSVMELGMESAQPMCETPVVLAAGERAEIELLFRTVDGRCATLNVARGSVDFSFASSAS